ncbi:hypothetical protein H632_c254p0 [Helicosporidium sp. ATCC 50920]|nr:hypothetical protein H632_c254p0 [Helicosporidium sp. ATCC 50920]|eukprot:KDD76359.1 hypothetical protein H632_c254p0 [Helicosporidium sp. ATCC 50920]
MSAAGPKAAQPARSADWFHPYEEQIRAAGAWDAEALVRGMKRRVAECNAGEEVLKRGEFVPFCVPGCSQPLGYIKASTVPHIRRAVPEAFEDADRCGSAVSLAPSLDTAAARSSVHMNGFTRLQDGSLALWVAQRSRSKPTWPGKLDHLVAGGQPSSLSCRENLTKECWEEAGIPQELAQRAVPVGAVSYASLQPEGLKRDVLFCYDLELPADFVPVPQDGEVEGFVLVPAEDVARLVASTDSFKQNCNLVLADFMVRHGVVHPDTKGYLELLRGLRSGDCS